MQLHIANITITVLNNGQFLLAWGSSNIIDSSMLFCIFVNVHADFFVHTKVRCSTWLCLGLGLLPVLKYKDMKSTAEAKSFVSDPQVDDKYPLAYLGILLKWIDREMLLILSSWLCNAVTMLCRAADVSGDHQTFGFPTTLLQVDLLWCLHTPESFIEYCITPKKVLFHSVKLQETFTCRMYCSSCFPFCQVISCLI